MQDRFDLCVVGAGVAGALTSYLLGEAGWRVLLLEAGPLVDHTTRLERAWDSLYLGIPPWPLAVPERDRFLSDGAVDYRLNSTRLFAVGGTTLHWGGIATRLHPDDFRERTRFGVGADWPITYEELERFYVQAEHLLGVSGPDQSPFGPSRSAGYPMPAFPLGNTERYWEEVCERVGVRIHPTAYAKNSVPYDGRPACAAFGTCSPICPIRAQYSADHHVTLALQTGHVQLVPGQYVRRVLTTSDGRRVTGVLATDADGRDQTFEADIVLLAAHAVETARLLLLSQSSAHSTGLGNGGDQVGRNFMEHWYLGGSVRLNDRRFYPFRLGFDPAESHQFYGREDRDSAGAIKLEFSDRLGDPHGLALQSGLRGSALGRHIEAEFGRWLAISAETEHLPYPNSRVTLHPSEVNAFGDPIPVVHLQFGEYELETRRRAVEIITRILEATGSPDVQVDDWRATPRWASHHLGTCRAGSDPESSVVDASLRVHGLENLFVVGSGVFPTGGAGQPTLTIAALACRLADHLSRGRSRRG
jgi:choline dehydrogenase-like flavoprotein